MTALIVNTERRESDALFLRMELGTAQMPDGRPVEMWISGATLGIEVGAFDGNDSSNRIVETLSLSALGTAWMRSIDDPGPDDDAIVAQVLDPLDLPTHSAPAYDTVAAAVRRALALSRGEVR